MIWFLYKNHAGDTYIEKDVCNDSDKLLGKFKNETQLRKLLEREGFYPQAIDYIVKDWKEANDDD